MNEKMRKAAIAMLQLQHRCLDRGLAMSLPVVEGMRYDCIIDTGERLWRTQVKYAGAQPANAAGCVHVRLDNPPGKGACKPYTDDIDLLCVYVPKPDILCVFESEVFFGRGGIQVRFSPSKNGQTKGCLMASDHTFEEWRI